jgi:hypothetical protein
MSDSAENINSVNVKEFPVGIVWIGGRGDLISCDIPGFGICKKFTDDPRLVDIGKKVFNGESFDLKPGTIIPPLGKE